MPSESSHTKEETCSPVTGMAQCSSASASGSSSAASPRCRSGRHIFEPFTGTDDLGGGAQRCECGKLPRDDSLASETTRGINLLQSGGKYSTVVADPPWDHSDGTGFNYGAQAYGGKHTPVEPHATYPPYVALSLEDITSLPVSDLAAPDAHLYLWTTQRYLHDSFTIVEAWGFTVSATLTWCKAPMGFMGGAYRSSTEFCHFARRGSLAHMTQWPTRWFTWPRIGWTQDDPAAKHSRKPEAFLDVVEQVSPGPYLELFARRNRLGWDTWGDQSLEHVEVAS